MRIGEGERRERERSIDREKLIGDDERAHARNRRYSTGIRYRRLPTTCETCARLRERMGRAMYSLIFVLAGLCFMGTYKGSIRLR